jgi:hypothetical protein
MADDQVADDEIDQAAIKWAERAGEDAWKKLCKKLPLPETFRREKETFLAGLAIGFASCLRIVRDTD